ncbi:MAG: hypothetical protein M0035_16545 [Actinomycetota bacterium]|nr:hypothetical protein [Actinomycetota bacterium]
MDASPGELCRPLSYKAAWDGSRLVVAYRWYLRQDLLSVRDGASQACRSPSAGALRALWSCHRPDLNAATSRDSLAEACSTTGTASGAGARRGKLPVNAQGEERFRSSPSCSSTNCEDGTSPELERTVTATRQKVAPKPVLAGSGR